MILRAPLFATAPSGAGFLGLRRGAGGADFLGSRGGAGADGGSVRRVWYNIGDGPIVQRIGHRPSKSTMLVRFQLGPPRYDITSMQ